MTKNLLAVFSLSFLFSCVSAPEPIELNAPPASAAFPSGNGKAEIVVLRQGIMGFIVGFGVHVNGERIGVIRSNDYVHTLVEPGRVKVLATAEANCPATFPVEANRSYYLNAKPRMGWWYARVQLAMMDPVAGTAARADCDDQTQKTDPGKNVKKEPSPTAPQSTP